MKKSHKHLNQHLEAEYYDDYIEPPRSSSEQSNLDNLFKLLSAQQDNTQHQIQDINQKNKDSTSNKNPQTALKQNNTINLTRLSIEMLRDLVAQLGKDAQNCVNNILEIRPMEDYQLLETYYSLHKEFQTMPFIFYSYSSKKAVYIWQINRLCPFKQASNSLTVDTRAFGSKKSLQISLVLLAKITGEENETILGIDILDEAQLMVKLICENQVILKLYDIKNFTSVARVNPFKEEVLASHLYLYKLALKEGNISEVSIWKRKTTEELDHELNLKLQMEQVNHDVKIEKESLIKRQILDGEFKPYFISGIYKTNNDVIILVCNAISKIITWKHDKLVSMSFDRDKTTKVHQIHNSLFLIYQDDDDFFSFFDDEPEEKSFQEICFADFPAVGVRDGSGFDSAEIRNMRADARKTKETRTGIKNNLSTRGPTQYDILVYNTGVSLTNPRIGTSKIAKQQPNKDEEEKNEASMLEKATKIVNHIKYSQTELTELQQQKEILKQIRADIKTRKTEIKSLDDQHHENYYKGLKSKNQDNQRPEEVPIEIMELYAQQKCEKKKITREREKDKDKDMKKRRHSDKNEF